MGILRSKSRPLQVNDTMARTQVNATMKEMGIFKGMAQFTITGALASCTQKDRSSQTHCAPSSRARGPMDPLIDTNLVALCSSKAKELFRSD